MAELQLLKEKLDKGFFVQNFYDMAQTCESLVEDKFGGPAFYILRSIFLDIARDWNGRPISVDEATEVKNKLDAPIRELVEVLETRRSKEALFESLAKLVGAEKQMLRTATLKAMEF